VLDHPEIIGRKGDNARRRALDLFSERRMLQDHVDLYRRLAPSGGGEKARHPA
jgi:hypothetical protein